MVLLLSVLFTSMQQLNYFPISWKHAVISPVQKSGKPRNKSSLYRPISLLSSLSKVYETILCTRILLHVDEQNILPQEQFGFRKGHACMHQAFRVINFLQNSINKRQYAIMLAHAVKQAFDKLRHDVLLSLLTFHKFPLYIVRMLASYLKDRTFQVKVQDKLSDKLNVLSGVPQGSKLGPFLFNMYLADIPQYVGIPQLALYADDTAVYHAGRNLEKLRDQIQSSLQSIHRFFTPGTGNKST